jgi:drug/metabolite transporter (DMT)-like permease
MSRLRADLLLLLAALIWGGAFVAQKESFNHVGAFTFVAARFALSAILVFPLAWRERRKSDIFSAPSVMSELVPLCIVFSAAIMLQQAGMAQTSVTNAGFLTGLYVVFVPAIVWAVYGQKPPVWIFPATILSVLGVWFLSGEAAQDRFQLNRGDILVLLCAVGFAWHIILVGRVMRRSPTPFSLCCLQYAVVAVAALAAAVLTEQPELKNILAAGYSILYAGVLSGGIAYTLQVVAQQYTPSTDSAVILSAESVFAALAGALFMQDRLTATGWLGCGLIFGAILLVELGPRLIKIPKPQP